MMSSSPPLPHSTTTTSTATLPPSTPRTLVGPATISPGESSSEVVHVVDHDEEVTAPTTTSSKNNKKKKKKKKKKKSSASTTASKEERDEEREEESEEEEKEDKTTEDAVATSIPSSPTATKEKEKETNTVPMSSTNTKSTSLDDYPLAPPAPRGYFEMNQVPVHCRRPFSGPFISQGLAKQQSKGKGEDAWVLKPECMWYFDTCSGDEDPSPSPAAAAAARVSAWGIFDGHGGKKVATFASNSLLKDVFDAAEAPCLPEGLVGPAVSPATLLEELEQESEPSLLCSMSQRDVEEWAVQAELTRRLPLSMTKGFAHCNQEAQRRFKAGGGTTATLAVAVGWELIVANVGDSLAFLDTGAEVLAVSGNHRLESNKTEVERILGSGGEVAPSTVDGKPAGPIRVWPGGLAMGRSIGDAEAGERVCAEAEICQVSIPYQGGRLLMGSDGLWDAIHPKTAAHHVRNLNAEAAAHMLLNMAIKKDHLKDDVTVVVVDFAPKREDRIPPILSSIHAANSKHANQAKVAHVWHPLSTGLTPRAAAAAAAASSSASSSSSPRHLHQHSRFDYIATGAERRQAVIAAQVAEEQERLEEERRLAEIEAEKAAQRALENGSAMPGLYAELAHLTLTPEEIAAAFQAEEKKFESRKKERDEKAAREESAWERVGSAGGDDKSSAGGNGGGRGRGRGSGRGRERGRGHGGGGGGNEKTGKRGPPNSEVSADLGSNSWNATMLHSDTLPTSPPPPPLPSAALLLPPGGDATQPGSTKKKTYMAVPVPHPRLPSSADATTEGGGDGDGGGAGNQQQQQQQQFDQSRGRGWRG